MNEIIGTIKKLSLDSRCILKLVYLYFDLKWHGSG